MDQFLKVLINMDLNMDRATIHGLIKVNTKEIGKIIKLKARELILGQMVESMKAIGKIQKCMAKAFITIQMEEDMMVIGKMTKKM